MPTGAKYETYTYCVDGADSIIFVNDAWCAFAIANDAPELTTEAVLHRCLWDFIADPETSHLYRAIFARARRSGNAVTIPFRCDAPALRRYMQLDIQPVDGGGERLQLTGRVLRQEPRAPVALLERAAQRSAELLRMCSWCKRIAVDTGQWLEAEEAIARLGLFDTPTLPGLTHTICDSCLAGLSTE
ncbi:MAG TPA: hypothetical protein VKA76_04025 [Gammaproteobacteria bacterium]|nr:hypothetical protein [Gammaproteobacteria bacterium]